MVERVHLSMGLFNLFSKPKKKKPTAQLSPVELRKLRSLGSKLQALLNADHYVSGKEYRDYLSQQADLIKWFRVLNKSGMLEEYCRKYGAEKHIVHKIPPQV